MKPGIVRDTRGVGMGSGDRTILSSTSQLCSFDVSLGYVRPCLNG